MSKFDHRYEIGLQWPDGTLELQNTASQKQVALRAAKNEVFVIQSTRLGKGLNKDLGCIVEVWDTLLKRCVFTTRT